jgi:hypothetical protein
MAEHSRRHLRKSYCLFNDAFVNCECNNWVRGVKMIMNCGYVGIRRESDACVNLRTELMCARSLSLQVARFQTRDCVLGHFRVN